MSAINDGGPAFPIQVNHEDIDVKDYYGLSMRDWFAGMALQGYLAGRNYNAGQYAPASVARDCYGYADAMLAARKEGA